MSVVWGAPGRTVLCDSTGAPRGEFYTLSKGAESGNSVAAIRGDRESEDAARRPVEQSDEVLWEGLRAGEETAFRDLFMRYNKMVYNFAYRHTDSWPQAEDITQATFTALWRRSTEGTIEPLGRLTAAPVLLTMARQECLNSVRRGNRYRNLLGKMRSQPARHPDNVAQWHDYDGGMAQIHRVLADLPENQRAVIELVWAGLDMAECADVLGVPVGTVKSRLNRARKKLATSEVAELLRGEG